MSHQTPSAVAQELAVLWNSLDDSHTPREKQDICTRRWEQMKRELQTPFVYSRAISPSPS